MSLKSTYFSVTPRDLNAMLENLSPSMWPHVTIQGQQCGQILGLDAPLLSAVWVLRFAKDTRLAVEGLADIVVPEMLAPPQLWDKVMTTPQTSLLPRLRIYTDLPWFGTDVTPKEFKMESIQKDSSRLSDDTYTMKVISENPRRSYTVEYYGDSPILFEILDEDAAAAHAEGTCPRCGDVGEWRTLALVCRNGHGVFAG